MARADLLALTQDDLAAMTNRGTVKRACRELEAAEATSTMVESADGEVRFEWSDGVKCTFPAGKTAGDARCTCPATTLCRHIVRSILAYQDPSAAANATAPAPPTGPWDPGEITDEQLATHYRPQVLSNLRSRFDQGILVELVRSAKPTARFHQMACTLRFVVPGDLRYTQCDCAETAPCSHVPLAIWAFRELPESQPAGIVSSQRAEAPVPANVLEEVEVVLRNLAIDGLSSLPTLWRDGLIRLQGQMEKEDLIWPAEILGAIVQQYEFYTSHDARFESRRVADLAGELLIRCDAIRNRTTALPQVLIRGSSSDRATDISSARYIGLGCTVQQGRGSVEIMALMQDSDSGTLAAVSREFANPAKDSKDEPKPFAQLAQTPALKGISLASLGAGQVLVQGGKRAPDHRLVVNRSRASSNPQGYRWETLRAPVLAESVAEIRARLAGLPPASLRPRYVAESLHVLPVAQVLASGFDEASQSVQVLIADAAGDQAMILHPYAARAAEGVEALLDALADSTSRLCFVAGEAGLRGGGLLFRPLTLVFENAAGRRGVQPWVDAFAQRPKANHHESSLTPSDQQVCGELMDQLGELLLMGLRRLDAAGARRWKAAAQHAEAVGYDRLAQMVACLAEHLEAKGGCVAWNPTEAVPEVLELLAIARLAEDLAG